MPRDFDQLVERQIQKALAEGALTGLEGEGKPLPDRSTEAVVDTAISVAMRMMAEAGAVPEEFRLKKLIEASKKKYRAAETDVEKRVVLALIADLEMRYNIAAEARRKFLG